MQSFWDGFEKRAISHKFIREHTAKGYAHRMNIPLEVAYEGLDASAKIRNDAVKESGKNLGELHWDNKGHWRSDKNTAPDVKTIVKHFSEKAKGHKKPVAASAAKVLKKGLHPGLIAGSAGTAALLGGGLGYYLHKKKNEAMTRGLEKDAVSADFIRRYASSGYAKRMGMSAKAAKKEMDLAGHGYNALNKSLSAQMKTPYEPFSWGSKEHWRKSPNKDMVDSYVKGMGISSKPHKVPAKGTAAAKNYTPEPEGKGSKMGLAAGLGGLAAATAGVGGTTYALSNSHEST